MQWYKNIHSMALNRVLTSQFWIELIIVGVLTVLIGYIAGYLVSLWSNPNLPVVCHDFDKNYVMEQTLFITGALTYAVLDLTGVLGWRCENRMN
jgi:hypothetical protein